MVLLKGILFSWWTAKLFIYIPIWFYWRISPIIVDENMVINLHSNMVLLKGLLLILVKCTLIIYIPIWFYWRANVFGFVHSFPDLHSNMVLLKARQQNKVAMTHFNLHSNMVLLKEQLKSIIVANMANLHSNMVLLKDKMLMDYHRQLMTFTFQYGSTEGHALIIVVRKHFFNLHSNMVLLKGWYG